MNAQIEEISANEQTSPAVSSQQKKATPLAVRIALCILLSVLLLADVVLIAADVTVRTFVTEDNIEKILDNTDYMTIPLTIDNVQSNLYEMFFFAFANASTDTVDIYKLAEETDFEGMIAEQLYNYAAFIFYDRRLEGIDSDVIMEFYDKNTDKIDNAFNVVYSRNEINEIIEKQEQLFDRLTNNEVEASIPMIKLIRFVMSPATLVIFIITVVALIVFIGIISRSAEVPLVAIGISVTAVGLAGTVVSCLAIFGKIGIPAVPVTTAGIIWQGFASTILPDIFRISVYTLTVGILLVITGGFIVQIRRNLRRAKKQ